MNNGKIVQMPGMPQPEPDLVKARIMVGLARCVEGDGAPETEAMRGAKAAAFLSGMMHAADMVCFKPKQKPVLPPILQAKIKQVAAQFGMSEGK